jgi:hypothetical protein
LPSVSRRRFSSIRVDGWKPYVSTALARWTVGLRRLDEATYRIWFFRVPLGDWRPGVDSTAPPLVDNATRFEPIPGAR